jgi:hypothetical protein
VASGAKTDRPQLRRLLAELDAGDVVMVTRLDRLARSTRDLLNTLAAIADRKAGFRSLGDAWADTTTAHGRLMLTVLGWTGRVRARAYPHPYRRGPGPPAPRRTGKASAESPSSPRTSSRKRFGGATKGSQCAQSPAATMSMRVRFHD